MNYFPFLLPFAMVSCGPPAGSALPSDREKQIVSGEDYLSETACWGGVKFGQEGVWIPVEFAVDKTEFFTKVGIVSRACKIETIDDFVNGAGGDISPYFASEWHAGFFTFVMNNVEDDENLLGSSKLLTSGSTTHVRYSENVIFFDGYMMLGRPIKAPAGGGEFFNVVGVARSPR